MQEVTSYKYCQSIADRKINVGDVLGARVAGFMPMADDHPDINKLAYVFKVVENSGHLLGLMRDDEINETYEVEIIEFDDTACNYVVSNITTRLSEADCYKVGKRIAITVNPRNRCSLWSLVKLV